MTQSQSPCPRSHTILVRSPRARGWRTCPGGREAIISRHFPFLVERRQLCEAGSIMPWATKDRNRLEDHPSPPSDPHARFCPELSYDWTDEEHIEAATAGSPAHLNTSALSGTRSPAVRDPLSYILPKDEPSRSRGASSKKQVRCHHVLLMHLRGMIRESTTTRAIVLGQLFARPTRREFACLDP